MITSNPDEFNKLAANPGGGPVVMLNLLAFRGAQGQASYARYTKEAGKFVEDVGGKVLYLGRPNELLNGEERWDLLMLVQYPSRQAFLSMINNSEYLKTHRFREEGVDRAVLYATDPIKFKEIR
ncbi:MAG: DUF1330 domain-containing protein [Deltaproteobacteria bacterium]|nr:DUF1330 domain-containing protein [Deltaproteobacteria bacterium]